MNTPKIRFKGFTDDWEQRKLGELGEIMTGSTPSTSKPEYYSENGIPWVTPTDIDALTISDTPRKLSEEGIKVGRVVPANTILCTCIASIGKNALLMVKGSFNQQINSLTPSAENDSYFLLTESELWSEKMKRMAASGTMQIVNKTEFSELVTMVSSLDEQKIIGFYFRNIDNLITLHQRKCDETKQLKKFMLQKMFPKNGEKNPEIRFEGFTDDWEQRKVGEFLTESRESGHKGDIAHKMTVKLWGKGVYEKKETGSANTQYFTRHAGQFIYSKLDFLNCAFGVVPEELENLETTADVPAFDCDGVNPYFMFYTAIQPRFYEKNGMIADGSRKAKRIHADTFLDMPFFVPSLKEQNKIVNLLSELDNLITLHQRKCEKIKELKKFMLQNMFV